MKSSGTGIHRCQFFSSNHFCLGNSGILLLKFVIFEDEVCLLLLIIIAKIMENSFSHIMKKKSNDELFKIIENISELDKHAVYAAYIEIRNRGIDIIALPYEFIKNVESEIVKDNQSNDYSSKLISKNFTYLLALVATPIVVGPIMIFNIFSLNDRRGVLPILLYTFLYSVASLFVFLLIQEISFFPLIILLYNGIATVLMIEVLWDKYSI